MTLGSGYWSDLARSLIAKGFAVRATLDGKPAQPQTKGRTTLEIEIEKSRGTGQWAPAYSAGDWQAGNGIIVNQRVVIADYGRGLESGLSHEETSANGRAIAALPSLHFALAMLQACPNDPRATVANPWHTKR